MRSHRKSPHPFFAPHLNLRFHPLFCRSAKAIKGYLPDFMCEDKNNDEPTHKTVSRDGRIQQKFAILSILSELHLAVAILANCLIAIVFSPTIRSEAQTFSSYDFAG